MTGLKFLFFAFMLISNIAYASRENLSLELNDANLRDAINIIAKFLKINVMISPSIRGVANLNLYDAIPAAAFDLLLTSHGLEKWQIGNVWYIGPREELIKRKQEELQWLAVRYASLPLFTRTWEIYYGSAKEIAHLLQNEQGSFLSKRGQVRVDVRTNTICVQDVAEQLAVIQQLIRRLDRPIKQVLIQARLASVDHDYERELGIHFAVSSSSTSNRDGLSGTIQPALGHYSLAIATLADGSLLDVKLAALENEGRAELISSPSLFTANQQSASIEAGEEVPYQEVSESGGTAIVFKKAVLGLKVTPQILPGHQVLLQLQINQDRPSHRMVLGMPTISTRQILTNVLVREGQTIVLGGIYESNKEEGQERIPFISRVPLLGLLFKQQHIRDNKRELLIFITPTIITSLYEHYAK
ncbi:MAG TPA: secretin N-terminal domain-containing protein [Gammaproteobacteria bacterium]|nr:secretin N-terminal domain-containing protein [Gammaproteobacteria bacterium]